MGKPSTYMKYFERPSRDQTQEEICAYYKGVQVGDLMCVQQTQGHFVTYKFFKIERIAKGRIYAPYASGLSSFWAKSGADCFHPKGQTRLVVPTVAIAEFADAYDMTVHGLTREQVEIAEVRALLTRQPVA